MHEQSHFCALINSNIYISAYACNFNLLFVHMCPDPPILATLQLLQLIEIHRQHRKCGQSYEDTFWSNDE